MARPRKRGLTYFPVDIDFFDDPKIIRFVAKYDTDAIAVYIAALCIVYREGYYSDLPRDLLCAQIAKMLGSRRLGADRIEAMLGEAVTIGLFDSPLFARGVLTSRSIQKRYAVVNARNKVDVSQNWLLPNTGSSGEGETIHSDGVFAAETGVFAAETGVFAAETPQNKIKENKIPPYNPPIGGRKERRRKEEVNPATFDVNEAFSASLERTYKNGSN